MGKNLKKCYRHLSNRAKKGKMGGKFSVFPEEIPILKKEGFIVSGFDSTELLTGKNSRKIDIFWGEPTNLIGIASRLKKLAIKYRHHSNSVARTCQVKADKQIKRKVATWMDNAESEYDELD